METPTHPLPLSAPHVEVPLITIVGGNRAESSYGSHWDVTDSKDETRPLVVYVFRSGLHETVRIRIELRSHLRSAIQRIMKGSLNLNLDADPLVFSRPFRQLIYHSNTIFEYIPENPEEEQALAKLRYFLSVESRDDIQSFRLARTQNIHTFEDLWTAYVPGELVIRRHLEKVWCSQVIGSSFDGRGITWNIEHRSWAFDGESFGYVHNVTSMERFHGARHGKENSLVPVRSLPSEEWEVIKAGCIARGHKWFRLQQQSHHFNYSAMVSSDKDNTDIAHVWGRVVVDPHAYIEENPCLRPRLMRTNLIPKEQLLQGQGCLLEDQALLAPPKIGGMVLDEDVWYNFWIDELKSIDWNAALWDNLDLEQFRKATIRTLVDCHDSSKYDFPAKGLGLILFLRGPPGTGKTSTVESLAELLRRPLYRVSPSQWNTSTVPERKFRTLFKLAHEWNAILLIDEADSIITASKRKSATLQAFLRQVEWYRGIAFLTSNMDQDIDDAVQSRLTGSLVYEYPSPSQAQRAWEQLLRSRSISQDEARACAVYLSKAWYLDFRKINAAVLLVDTLAKAQGTPITREMIEKALVFKGEKLREKVADADANISETENALGEEVIDAHKVSLQRQEEVAKSSHTLSVIEGKQVQGGAYLDSTK